MKTPLIALLTAVPLLALPATALAKKDKGQGHPHAEAQGDAKSDLTIVITGDERDVIREYYGAPKGKPLPPGLQKKLARGGELPPGWQKKLARGEVVPADLWALRQPLPGDVLRRLPPQPAGVLTVRVDNQILRVAAATLILLDVFQL